MVKLYADIGRPRGTVGKVSASEARSPGFGPPWLGQRSRWESRPLALVGNNVGAVTLLIDRKGSVFPRWTGRFLVKIDVHIASFRCLSEERLSFLASTLHTRLLPVQHWLFSLVPSILFSFFASYMAALDYLLTKECLRSTSCHLLATEQDAGMSPFKSPRPPKTPQSSLL